LQVAGRKIVGAIYQERIFVGAEVQMPAMPSDDHRQAASHSFCSGKIETLSPGRKYESIGNLVEKLDLPLVEFFGNDLDRGGEFGSAGELTIIGSFGFLLPGKGLTELIYSFALILRAYPDAYLLMLNADYPTPESQEQRERCLALVRLLEMEGHLTLINEFLDIEDTLLLSERMRCNCFPLSAIGGVSERRGTARTGRWPPGAGDAFANLFRPVRYRLSTPRDRSRGDRSRNPLVA
jgi:hypothetical protein